MSSRSAFRRRVRDIERRISCLPFAAYTMRSVRDISAAVLFLILSSAGQATPALATQMMKTEHESRAEYVISNRNTSMQDKWMRPQYLSFCGVSECSAFQ
jgi:hypothetical protein